ncbi:MAG: shikimate dehydrogenase [Bacteroidota bacterium]
MSKVQFGLIGKKLGHSFSRKYFTEKFEEIQYPGEYQLYELASVAELPELIRRNPHLRGLNVTIPYKSEVIPYMASLSPEAEAVGAVNTILIEGDRWTGHNSDVFGFRTSLHNHLPSNPEASALILGTGGAAKAVAYVLKNMNWRYQMVSRHPEGETQISYQELETLDWQAFSVVINTTPLGMYPKTEAAPPLPYHRFSTQHLAFDLIYNPAETSFMRQAAEQGAQSLNGMEMLILQAERSWEIWQSRG